MKNVLFKRLHPNAKLPTKAYRSAGYDLFPCISGIIKPGEQVKIPLGFASEFPIGYVAQFDDRSSTGKAGLSHMAGVIDSDYRGEWMVMMRNHSDVDYVYSPDKAIVEVLFIKVEEPEWRETDTLEESERGERGFGSSD